MQRLFTLFFFLYVQHIQCSDKNLLDDVVHPLKKSLIAYVLQKNGKKVFDTKLEQSVAWACASKKERAKRDQIEPWAFVTDIYPQDAVYPALSEAVAAAQKNNGGKQAGRLLSDDTAGEMYYATHPDRIECSFSMHGAPYQYAQALNKKS